MASTTIRRGRRDPKAGGNLTSALFFTIAGWVIPIILVVEAPVDMLLPALGLWLVTLASSAALALNIRSIVIKPFRYVFWLFAYLFMGISPLIQINFGWPGTTPRIDMSFIPRAVAITLAGMLAFAVGGAFHRHRSSSAVTAGSDSWLANPDGGYALSINERRAIWVGNITSILSIYYMFQVGFDAMFGARHDFGNIANFEFENAAFAAIFLAFARYGLLASVVAQVITVRRSMASSNRRRLVLLLFHLVVLAVMVNPFSTTRFIFGTVFGSLAVSLGIWSTPSRWRRFQLSFAGLFAVLMPIADSFRYSTTRGLRTISFSESFVQPDFDAFAQLVNTVSFTVHNGYLLGRQFVGSLGFFVPRAIWTTKPEFTGHLIAEHMGYRYTNLSAPLWAELYIDWSIMGVILGFAALGAVSSKLDSAVVRQVTVDAAPTVIGSILPFYMIFVLRGSLLPAVGGLVSIAVVCAFVQSPRRAQRDMLEPEEPAQAAGFQLAEHTSASPDNNLPLQGVMLATRGSAA